MSIIVDHLYRYLIEAVNINKDYLIKQLGGDVEKFKQLKSEITSLVEEATNGFNASSFPEKSKMWLINLLMNLRLDGALPTTLKTFIHDIVTDGKLGIISKLNSDSRVSDLNEIIENYNTKKMSQNGSSLSSDEQCIWLRVKTFHDFGDGFKWIIALDANGEPAGFIPSEVTFKTMNHCGNTPSVQQGDVYYGLRDANNKEYVSVIVNGEGKIRESKGYDNKVPKEKAVINKYMQWLMKNPIISGTDYGAGYSRHTNYGVSKMIDDKEFMDYSKNEKPELIDPVDKTIIEYSEKLETGEMTEDDVKNEFLEVSNRNEFPFESLIGILGKNPFTEAEMVDLIRYGTIRIEDIANAGNQYLTVPVQHAGADEGQASVLYNIYFNTPHNKIDVEYLNSKYILDAFDYIPKEKVDDFVREHYDAHLDTFMGGESENWSIWFSKMLRPDEFAESHINDFIASSIKILDEWFMEYLKKPIEFIDRNFDKLVSLIRVNVYYWLSNLNAENGGYDVLDRNIESLIELLDEGYYGFINVLSVDMLVKLSPYITNFELMVKHRVFEKLIKRGEGVLDVIRNIKQSKSTSDALEMLLYQLNYEPSKEELSKYIQKHDPLTEDNVNILRILLDEIDTVSEIYDELYDSDSDVVELDHALRNRIVSEEGYRNENINLRELSYGDRMEYLDELKKNNPEAYYDAISELNILAESILYRGFIYVRM